MFPRTSTRFQFSPVYTAGVQDSIDSVVAAMTPTSLSAMMKRSNVVSAEYASALGKDFFGTKVRAIEEAKVAQGNVITPEISSALGKQFCNRDFNVVKNDDFATIFVDSSPKYRDYSCKFSAFNNLPSCLYEGDIDPLNISHVPYPYSPQIVQAYDGHVSVTATSVHMERTESSETSVSSVSIQIPEDLDYTFLRAVEQSEEKHKADDLGHSPLSALDQSVSLDPLADKFNDVVEIHPSDHLLSIGFPSTASEASAAPRAVSEDVHQPAPTLVESVTSRSVYYDACEGFADTDEAAVLETLPLSPVELAQSSRSLTPYLSDASEAAEQSTVVEEVSYPIERVERVVKERKWRTKLSVPWKKLWFSRRGKACPPAPQLDSPARFQDFPTMSSATLSTPSFGSLIIVNHPDAEEGVKDLGLGVFGEKKKAGRVRGFVYNIVKGARSF